MGFRVSKRALARQIGNLRLGSSGGIKIKFMGQQNPIKLSKFNKELQKLGGKN
ncbi:hypothetical protein OXYTRIMIC_651 [Oxytricha trifallax]|uniref:Uncharacterized protein n=1 Tax=Oxytricha trifallax TaxID=1172189 RepID=A0A073HXJ6_9SPIT|nr:hypothetical protein OXYTRIMIC_651 [Oxytricha trifallax]